MLLDWLSPCLHHQRLCLPNTSSAFLLWTWFFYRSNCLLPFLLSGLTLPSEVGHDPATPRSGHCLQWLDPGQRLDPQDVIGMKVFCSLKPGCLLPAAAVSEVDVMPVWPKNHVYRTAMRMPPPPPCCSPSCSFRQTCSFPKPTHPLRRAGQLQHANKMSSAFSIGGVFPEHSHAHPFSSCLPSKY